MGTRGYFAYRYKRRYYVQFMNSDAYPSWHGERFARSIPRDAKEREAWMLKKVKMLEEASRLEVGEARGHYLRDQVVRPADAEDGDDLGFRIWPFDNAEWTRFGSNYSYDIIEYTYVIDLDNCVFTINGVAHCKFDNMPPDNLDAYFDDQDAPTGIPPEHLTTAVDLWPHFDLDVGEARQNYNKLQAIVVPHTAWGAPTWESLSVSQNLCIELIRALVNHYSYELSCPNFSRVQDHIGRFCWQVLSSAAPSGSFYSSKFGNEAILCYIEDDRATPAWPSSVAWYLAHRRCDKDTRYCFFRGCLVTPCHRLDEPAHLKYEVKQMADALQKNGRTGGVGIIISSWQVLAVTVDSNSEVRHSPALDFHDGKGGLCDGVLLMMHLLSPVLTTPKTPWSNVQPRKSCTLGSSLPTELLDQIVQLTDFRTYLNLHSVSSSIRAICLARPRIGDFTILGKKLGQEGVFEVRSSSNASALATIEPKKSVNAMGMPWQMVILSDNGEPDGEN